MLRLYYQQKRVMELNRENHIHSDAKILMGKPVIKNTRISVELLLELFASG